MSEPGESKPGNGTGDRHLRRLYGYGAPPDLPDSATPQEVHQLGLRFFKWLLEKQVDPMYRIKVMDLALKWIKTEPVELPEKEEGELKEMIAEVTGIRDSAG